MTTFFAIVGFGPNNLEIPLVVCRTREEAQAIVDQLPKGEGDWLADDFTERKAPYVDDEYESTVEGHRLYSLIFKNGEYYSGCGGCYSVEIKEFTFGLAMVAWDLD